MGTDISSYVEIHRDGRWIVPSEVRFKPIDEYEDGSAPFQGRDYGLFGFLADVRNYAECPTITPCRGLPDDVSDEVAKKYDSQSEFVFGTSWLTLAELLAYDYDRTFVNQRPSPWQMPHATVRDFLGDRYFERLAELGNLGAPDEVRVVFWFDS
jgi:hypothetical protein